jgi:hypothetical protein
MASMSTGEGGNGGGVAEGLGRMLRDRGTGTGIDIHIHAVVTGPGLDGAIGFAALTGGGGGGTPFPVMEAPATGGRGTTATTANSGLGSLFGGATREPNRRGVGSRRFRSVAPPATVDATTFPQRQQPVIDTTNVPYTPKLPILSIQMIQPITSSQPQTLLLTNQIKRMLLIVMPYSMVDQLDVLQTIRCKSVHPVVILPTRSITVIPIEHLEMNATQAIQVTAACYDESFDEMKVATRGRTLLTLKTRSVITPFFLEVSKLTITSRFYNTTVAPISSRVLENRVCSLSWLKYFVFEHSHLIFIR